MAKFDLVCPDGMPLVWAINRQLPENEQLTDRVYGPTLMWKTLEASGENQKHFLFGGMESTLEKMEARCKKELPDANIVGSYSPPFGHWDETELKKIFGLFRESGANIIWVGLGCPKQESWVAMHKHELPPAVYLTVGAAFAFHAGEVRQAPDWIQRRGLEWAFRLTMEPKRLFKRYFVNNARFIYYSLRDRIAGA